MTTAATLLDRLKNTGNIPGFPVNLSGTVFAVPPLNFKQLKALEPDLKRMGSMQKDLEGGVMPADAMETFHKVVLASLNRNYPDLTSEDLEELMDVSNIKDLVAAVLGMSDLEKKTPGELTPGAAAK